MCIRLRHPARACRATYACSTRRQTSAAGEDSCPQEAYNVLCKSCASQNNTFCCLPPPTALCLTPPPPVIVLLSLCPPPPPQPRHSLSRTLCSPTLAFFWAILFVHQTLLSVSRSLSLSVPISVSVWLSLILLFIAIKLSLYFRSGLNCVCNLHKTVLN